MAVFETSHDVRLYNVYYAFTHACQILVEQVVFLVIISALASGTSEWYLKYSYHCPATTTVFTKHYTAP